MSRITNVFFLAQARRITKVKVAVHSIKIAELYANKNWSEFGFGFDFLRVDTVWSIMIIVEEIQ